MSAIYAETSKDSTSFSKVLPPFSPSPKLWSPSPRTLGPTSPTSSRDSSPVYSLFVYISISASILDPFSSIQGQTLRSFPIYMKIHPVSLCFHAVFSSWSQRIMPSRTTYVNVFSRFLPVSFQILLLVFFPQIITQIPQSFIQDLNPYLYPADIPRFISPMSHYPSQF